MRVNPWGKDKPRLAYPASDPRPAVYVLPEPDFRLVTYGTMGGTPMGDPQRQREEDHYRWHQDNPWRVCEYGSAAHGPAGTNPPPAPPRDRG